MGVKYQDIFKRLGVKPMWVLVKEKYHLTPRELEISELLCGGWTNKQIADFLKVSVSTVEAVISRLFLKFHVPNRVQLVLSILYEICKRV